jgi:DnaD/phage-associated family protein
MPGNYWIKLYIEIIDDPKMATLPDRLWRRVIELFLLAGKMGEDGLLPTTSQLAWLMRMETDDLELDMQQLSNTGIIEAVPNGWFIPRFRERQEPAPDALRSKEYRKRARQEQYYGVDTVTKRDASVTQINRLTDTESYTEQNHNHTGDGDKSSITPNIFQLYEQNIGMVQPLLVDKLKDAEKEYPIQWVQEAFATAVNANARNWNYVHKCLVNRRAGYAPGKQTKRGVDVHATPDGMQKYGEWEAK